ncbi:unnamed protein product, partial [Rotaria magnacalcarata]
ECSELRVPEKYPATNMSQEPSGIEVP